MLRKKEKEALRYFSGNDVEITTRPFAKAANVLKTTEDELVRILYQLQEKGFLKKMRGALNHYKAGYRANALIAWQGSCAKEGTQSVFVQDICLNDSRISHCYQRKPHKNFNYSIFTMMHARTKNEVIKFARDMARRFKLNYEILFTEAELKKERLALGSLLC